ncbi:MAG TPA: glycoside hydrolase family 97 N-terminal domain-containing protein, partial [Flavobacterium sp.]
MSSLFMQSQMLESPSKDITLQFRLDDGKPLYSILYKRNEITQFSRMGFELKGQSALTEGFELLKSTFTTINQTWNPVLGEVASIKNHCNELRVELIQRLTGRKLDIVFRAFDHGVAFRYEFPKQEKLNYFIISKESTEFNLTADHKAFWIPGDFDSQEYAYNETKLSEIDVDRLDMNNGIGFKGPMKKTRVQSPLMIKTSNQIYLNIFEAAVINYPVMHLLLDPKTFSFTADLAPNAIGDLAYLQTPFNSPWRTLMVSDDARDILGSKMILNLNEPSNFTDTSWIKPMKYVGIWWEMHVGRATWDYAGSQNAQNAAGELKPSGKHGATTENTKKY